MQMFYFPAYDMDTTSHMHQTTMDSIIVISHIQGFERLPLPECRSINCWMPCISGKHRSPESALVLYLRDCDAIETWTDFRLI